MTLHVLTVIVKPVPCDIAGVTCESEGVLLPVTLPMLPVRVKMSLLPVTLQVLPVRV